jgi:hypothetical protein
MPDFIFQNHGSVVTVTAESNAAKEFARENLAVEGWQGSPERFTTDWRPAQTLMQQLAGDGFEVAEA